MLLSLVLGNQICQCTNQSINQSISHPHLPYLLEEGLGLAENVLELGELGEVLLQRLLVLVHLAQLVLKLLKGRLRD